MERVSQGQKSCLSVTLSTVEAQRLLASTLFQTAFHKATLYNLSFVLFRSHRTRPLVVFFTKQRLLQRSLNRVSQRTIDMMCAAPVERQFPVALVVVPGGFSQRGDGGTGTVVSTVVGVGSRAVGKDMRHSGQRSLLVGASHLLLLQSEQESHSHQGQLLLLCFRRQH